MDLVRPVIQRIVFPAMERFKDNHIRKYTATLRAHDAWAPGELRAFQIGRLGQLLTDVLAHVPAYREFQSHSGEALEDPEGVLRRLPMLSKREFRRRSNDYLHPGFASKALIPNRTSGSTGEPTHFYLDRESVEWYEAARWRSLSWWGIEPFDRSMMIWGDPLELSPRQRRLHQLKERYLKNRQMMSAYALRPEELEADLTRIRRYRPRYLYGYASALDVLAQRMLDRGLKLGIPLRGVVSTAETLQPWQRERIGSAFAAPVINEYGAKDGGMLAYECPAGGMHVMSDAVWIEVVDPDTGEAKAPGEEGIVLVTDLNNHVMPRLRYQVGDRAVVGTDVCSCGRPYPLFETIQGREDEVFVASSGELIHGHYFAHLMRNLKGIAQFQLIQHDPDHMTLKVVRGDDYHAREVADFITEVQRKMGADVKVRFEMVVEIPPTPTGKVRYAYRAFDPSAPSETGESA